MGKVIAFNTTFKSISVISWRSVLLVKKTTDMSQVIDTESLLHIAVSSTPRLSGIRIHNFSGDKH